MSEPWYDPDHEVRWVRSDGTIKWRGTHIFISEVLEAEPVGLIESDRGGHLVGFCGHDVGLIDASGRIHRFAPPRWRLRSAREPARTEDQ